jgi:phosphonate metabolism protein PhnN/1,5-bisphosphokinase (PRPP-forming)
MSTVQVLRTPHDAMTRYALYFSPAIDSPWWQAGCRWLGRDPVSGAEIPQPAVAGVPPAAMQRLTSDARRYGFHATLKAPFRLREGFSESHLLTMAEAFANAQRPISLDDTRVQPLGSFLALRPARPLDDIASLAMRCVSYFDDLRGPLTPGELEKRRNSGLSARQESLLQRWGYPYTEEEFCFHMTLTDSLAGLDEDAAHAMRNAVEGYFQAAMQAEPLVVDALTIFREQQPGLPFSVWRRFPFKATGASSLPAGGRLYFLVGPSGAGKDTLLQWLQQRMPSDGGTVFARRTITRPAHASESHEPTDAQGFWQLAAAGHFSMIWQANDLCYGIPRGIEAELKAGRDVVVNGSREFVPQLRQLFPQARVIWVEADTNEIRKRIEGRRRESGAALLKRLDRVAQFEPTEEVIRLDNSGPVEEAGQRLLEILGGA